MSHSNLVHSVDTFCCRSKIDLRWSHSSRLIHQFSRDKTHFFAICGIQYLSARYRGRARYERHPTTDTHASFLSIFHQNVEAGSNTGSRLRFKALSSPVVKPFLVQEFESFVRDRPSYLWVTAYRPQASRTTKRTWSARHTRWKYEWIIYFETVCDCKKLKYLYIILCTCYNNSPCWRILVLKNIYAWKYYYKYFKLRALWRGKKYRLCLHE